MKSEIRYEKLRDTEELGILDSRRTIDRLAEDIEPGVGFSEDDETEEKDLIGLKAPENKWLQGNFAALTLCVLLTIMFTGFLTLKGIQQAAEINQPVQIAPAAAAELVVETDEPTTTFSPPTFVRSKEFGGITCDAMFKEPTFNFTDWRKHRIPYKDPTNDSDLPMDCESIMSRSFFQMDDYYPEEREFPLAFARAVFRDYRFIEMELAMSYAPQNHYCYAVDSNVPRIFHERMRALANCFPNVYLTRHEFHMDSAGHNMGYSHHECMIVLDKPEKKWKYVMLLQNHDVQLKSNEELIQIFRWYNGTNDISANNPPMDRVNKHDDWSFAAMKLFKNETRNTMKHKGFMPTLRFAKSLVQVSVSREMIHFLLNDLNLDGVLRNFDWNGHYGIDEIMMGSLNAEDAIEAPGGYTRYCLDHRHPFGCITRLSIWAGNACKTGMWRHGLCIFGAEYFPRLEETVFLFANKFYPENDMSSIVCWHENIFNRTHYARGIHRLRKDVYLKMPHVRYNQERKRLGDKFDVTKFDCSMPKVS